MVRLFDGCDAHLLPGNAELIQRLNEPELHYPGNFDTVKRANAILMCLCQEAADALESADKRIAELEARENILVSANSLANIERNEAERKLAVVRKALKDLCDWDGDLVLKDFCEDVLAQIGEDS